MYIVDLVGASMPKLVQFFLMGLSMSVTLLSAVLLSKALHGELESTCSYDGCESLSVYLMFIIIGFASTVYFLFSLARGEDEDDT